MKLLHFYIPQNAVCLHRRFLHVFSLRSEPTAATASRGARRVRAFCARVLCASALCAALCFMSCRNGTAPLFGGKEVVSIACPRWFYEEGAQSGLPQAYALYIDSDGSVQKIALAPNALLSGGAQEQKLKVVLAKNRVTPFLFYRGGTDTKPQGCVYPYDTHASVSGGFTAFVLYKLLLSDAANTENIYERASLFNWQKLHAFISAYEDPWILNDELMVQKIAEGKFGMRHIKKK